MRIHLAPFACALIIAILLSSCASTGNDVTWRVDTCCPDPAASSFSLTTEDVPYFLESILVSNVSAAMAGAGFQPLAEAADLHVTVRYEQDNLAPVTRYNRQDERVSEGGDVRYVARVVIEMHDDEGLMFRGSIDRLHDVSPGEYMHTGRGSLAIYQSLVSLLEIIR